MDVKKVMTGPLPIRQTRSMVTLRLDDDVVTWLKSFGPGYQLRINAMLRVCMMEYQEYREANHVE